MVTQGNVIVGLGTGFIKIGAYGAAEGACVDLGATEGGASIEGAREYYEKKVDQELGPLELIKTSERFTLKFVLAECTLENLGMALDYPDAAIAADVLSLGGDKTVTPRTLFLTTPGTSGGNRKYHFWKVVFISAAAHSYKKNDKTMIECEVVCVQDTSQTANQQIATITDTGGDTTPPTIAMSVPTTGGTVTQGTLGTVELAITETNIMNENTIVYGDNDNATIQIMDITTPATPVLKAGTISYNPATKKVLFTPTAAWTTGNDFMVIVTTGLADAAGNHLAATFIGVFSAT
jgi:hypothetical protein